MEDITDADYKHVKRVWKDFKLQNLGYYHDLHLHLQLSQQIHWNIWIWSSTLSISTRISMASTFKEDWNIKIINWYCYGRNSREKESEVWYAMQFIDTQRKIICTYERI